MDSVSCLCCNIVPMMSKWQHQCRNRHHQLIHHSALQLLQGYHYPLYPNSFAASQEDIHPPHHHHDVVHHPFPYSPHASKFLCYEHYSFVYALMDSYYVASALVLLPHPWMVTLCWAAFQHSPGTHINLSGKKRDIKNINVNNNKPWLNSNALDCVILVVVAMPANQCHQCGTLPSTLQPHAVPVCRSPTINHRIF